ncbi:tRNA (adenosine(37)-N6)-threonylcarbamoyltransferase complex dimerization subunit type 1 TsaB [Bacillus sp. FJAT-45350]|uniref:tRNA (adenosine(37)-N6)-threonylcarbamoyltransferase complex dimerization subunit type 1 TsaB n=1 Tax=Bacillus sp. FJAT-45350 TaxID=2011014 RepID=UPI000BB78540|nr:tRNA (adenosine(37)-N6)-threonylcarbamoyltransferase complex dimerization subunit type 1 TsaB [Bacillus sp. FJAT-45350]
MKTLAIDTSNLIMGVAVVDGENVLGEMITNIKKNHSLRLMPAIDELMREVGMKPKDLERIVVAEGPGSYTGVRIGVTTAKTLAWSLNIPIVGVSSLETLAQNGRYFQGSVSPIFDARRGQVFTGLYRSIGNQVTQVWEDRLVLLEDWLQQIKEQEEQVLFLGNDLSIHQQTIQDVLGDQAKFGVGSQRNPRPSEIAMLALEREPAGDVHQFVPKYLRLAEAEANWLAEQEGKVGSND